MHSIISKLIWGGGRPRIRLTTLQCNKRNGGLTLHFILDLMHCARFPTGWTLISWRPIEEHLAFPHHLQDLIHSGLSIKRSKLKLGPIMSFLLAVWRSVERVIGCMLKWHAQSPIFHNYSSLTGGVPFSSREWSGRGINILSDTCDDGGLRLFNDLRATYDMPSTSFFLYLRLRSAMRAYGVPWGTPLPTHKLRPDLCSLLFFISILVWTSGYSSCMDR